MDTLLILVFTFIFFMVIWAVGIFIGRSIQKKRLTAFKAYIRSEMPDINLEKQDILIAKQKSKQVRPDILLMIKEDEKEIILVTGQKGSEITQNRYHFDDLVSVESNNQIISRGVLPKTYSYEESIIISFKDHKNFQLVLENISNKHGDDKGADVVREIFSPYLNILKNLTH